MTALNELRSRLQQDDYAFSETLAFVAEHYDYQPSAFRNGDVENAAGQNEGSCKTLGLALLEGLSQGELVRAADAVVKDAILEGASKVSPDALRDALQNRQTLKGKFRRQPGR
mgnify:CR=1 FL=1